MRMASGWQLVMGGVGLLTGSCFLLLRYASVGLLAIGMLVLGQQPAIS